MFFVNLGVAIIKTRLNMMNAPNCTPLRFVWSLTRFTKNIIKNRRGDFNRPKNIKLLLIFMLKT